MRGRKAVPTELRVLEGRVGSRYHQPPGGRGVRQVPRVPACPSWLDPEAKRKWREVARLLGKASLITPLDAGVLTAYCVIWSRWRRLEAVLESDGQTFTTAAGTRRQRPEAAIARGLLQELRLLGQELGLGPASRGRMVAPKASPDLDDEMERLLQGLDPLPLNQNQRSP